MMPTELLCGSKTAAIAWVTSPEGIVEKRVYFQDLSGHIRESRRTANYPWRGGTVDDVVGRAKPFSPLAAIVWNTDVKKGRQIRVYYIGDDNTLCGSSFDGEYWHYGPGDRGLGSDGFRVDVASNSKLAAVHWARDGPEKDSDIRIYYQKNNDVGSPIFEHKYVASKRLWEPGYTFGDPVAGTSIAAINVDNGCIKVYFQSCLDRAICESCIHQGAEPFSGLKTSPESNLDDVSISAFDVSLPSVTQFGVFWQTGGDLFESRYDSGTWKQVEKKDARSMPSFPETHISACSWGSSFENVGVIFQGSSSALYEWKSPTDEDWPRGAQVPTGTPKGWP